MGDGKPHAEFFWCEFLRSITRYAHVRPSLHISLPAWPPTLKIVHPPSRPVRTQAPEHLGQGLTQGMMYFGHTVKDGITGVVMKPIRGAQRDGAFGFVKGVGKGVVGLVAAPVSGETAAANEQPFAASGAAPPGFERVLRMPPWLL